MYLLSLGPSLTVDKTVRQVGSPGHLFSLVAGSQWPDGPSPPFQHVFKSGNSNQCTIMKHYPFSILQVLCIASVKKVLYPLHGVLLIQMLPSNHTDQNRAGPGLVMLPKQLLNTFISHQNSSVVTFQVIFCLTPMLKNEQQEGRD